MSQEQPPVRSRRELRQARDETLEQTQDAGTTGPGQVPPTSKQTDEAPGPVESTGRIRHVAAGPVDSVPAISAAERSSQIRARDRAALRAIKELAEKEEQLSAGGPPTRRQLRLQQLQEQAVTSAIPVVSPAKVRPAAVLPAAGSASAAQPAPRPRELETPNPPMQPSGGADCRGLPSDSVEELPHGMTVDQALAARSLIAEQARNQLAKMEHIASHDPEAVDPEILAQQIALAERAAVLNRRAMAKQKLAEQNSQPPLQRQDPSAASNLAMVTPLEFVQVPGVDRPVMKPPATSYLPLVTSPGPRLKPHRAAGPRPSSASRLAGAGPLTGRSRVLARAEAAAKAATLAESSAAGERAPGSGEDLTELRVAAKAAYGLEPLDAVTAGLGRAQRIRLLQLGVLALGIVALIAGITMIISGLSR
ncbi:hypothetical protein V3C33_09810 [Micrococcaceae bacterium Sec5.7]